MSDSYKIWKVDKRLREKTNRYWKYNLYYKSYYSFLKKKKNTWKQQNNNILVEMSIL